MENNTEIKTINTFLVGLGNVNRNFLRILEMKSAPTGRSNMGWPFGLWRLPTAAVWRSIPQALTRQRRVKPKKRERRYARWQAFKRMSPQQSCRHA